jgi:hypothetical protein
MGGVGEAVAIHSSLTLTPAHPPSPTPSHPCAGSRILEMGNPQRSGFPGSCAPGNDEAA